MTGPDVNRKLLPLLAAAVVIGAFVVWGALGSTSSSGWLSKAKRLVGLASQPIAFDSTRARLLAEGLSLPLVQPRLVARKEARTLELFDGERLVRTYDIALGGDPIGAKRRRGDGRTPEGAYHLCTRVNPSQFHLFLGISYPASHDIAGHPALEEAARDAIADAERNRTVPPWDTPLGGAIGLHGGGTSRDWTAGCLAVEDGAIEELWLLTTNGTPIFIEP